MKMKPSQRFYIEGRCADAQKSLCKNLRVTEDMVSSVLCNDGESREMVEVSEDVYKKILAGHDSRQCFCFWVSVYGKPAMTHDESRSALEICTPKHRQARSDLRKMLRRNGGRRAAALRMAGIKIPGRREASRR